MTAHPAAAHARRMTGTWRPTRGKPSRASRRYFTDGGRLYRFIDWVVRSKSSMLAVVEDCGSLEILIVRAEQLNAWREVASEPRRS
jgi:hypothetical protein